MRIATWASNYPPHPGGLEVVVESLSRAQVRLGHEVCVTTSAFGGRHGASTEEGVEVRRLPAVHFTESLGVPYPIPCWGTRSAARQVSTAEVQHAHGALYATTIMACRIARRTARPLVVTEHVGFVPYGSSLLNLVQSCAWRLIGDRVIRQAAAVVTLNDRVRRWLADRFPDQTIRLVPNGLTLDGRAQSSRDDARTCRRRLGLPEDVVLPLFVGRSAAKKNLTPLLAALSPDLRLVVCGAERRSLPPAVLDLGVLPHSRMSDVYGACDFLVHLGVSEGFPVVVQEAAAHGLPILLLWDRGYEDTLRREAVLAIDTLDELSSALRCLASDVDRRVELRARARSWAEGQRSWSECAGEYLEIYREALASAAHPSPIGSARRT